MDLGLKGKHALITGGSRGLGRAIAERLAAEGAHVAVCARSQDGVDAAVESLRQKDVTVYGEAVDVASGDALRDWIAKAAAALGGIDIFVSNTSAGNQGQGEQNWRNHFEIDVLGAVRSFETCLPFFEQAGGGSFVIISTTAAVETFGNVSGYGPMKAALINYMNHLSQAYAAKQIRVNAISPGPTYFEGGPWARVEAAAPQFFDLIMKQEPMGRMGSDTDVANATAFIASPAASFITGVNLVVDGGFTRRVNF